jgi:uncharacterized protein YjcR
MARAPDERYNEAYNLFRSGKKLIEIANQLNLPEGTVRRWKSTHKWDNERSDKKSERSERNKGGQPGNKNALGNDGGAPPENKNAEKHGFFAKWLPEETMEIMQSIQSANPLDLLWDNICLQYTAIIRAQNIMHVKDSNDANKIVSSVSKGKTNSMTYKVQFADDRQSSFLLAQSRAMKTLESMIKQYDEMLHNNWDLATEEQKQRIAVMKAQSAKLSGSDNKDELQKLDEVLAQIKGVV